MPTENWYPISTATHDLPAGMDDWALAAGADKNVATTVGGGRAGPATHNDATDYISSGTNGWDQTFNIDWPGPIGSLASTFNYNIRHNSQIPGGDDAADYIESKFANAAGTLGGVISNPNPTNSWVNTGPTDVSNGVTYKPGATAWAASDFANDMTTFPRIYSGGIVNDAHQVTSIWGALEYNSPAGGFAFLLGLAGLMSLQLAGPMTDYTQFEKFLQWRHDIHPRHTILTSDEKAVAWDEYKSYTHPRFFYG